MLKDSAGVAVPDNQSAGITRELQATGKGTLAQLQVTVDISHPYIGDLGASLVSPECVREGASRGHCQQCGQHRCDTYRRHHTRFRAVGG